MEYALPGVLRLQIAPLATVTTALMTLLPIITLPGPALELDSPLMMFVPPSMFHVPLMLNVLLEVITIFAASWPRPLEVVSVLPALKLKKELVAPPEMLLVTNN